MILTKITQFVKDNSKDITLALIIFLISLFSFAGGYLTARYQQNGEDIQILAPIQSQILAPIQSQILAPIQSKIIAPSPS